MRLVSISSLVALSLFLGSCQSGVNEKKSSKESEDKVESYLQQTKASFVSSSFKCEQVHVKEVRFKLENIEEKEKLDEFIKNYNDTKKNSFPNENLLDFELLVDGRSTASNNPHIEFLSSSLEKQDKSLSLKLSVACLDEKKQRQKIPILKPYAIKLSDVKAENLKGKIKQEAVKASEKEYASGTVSNIDSLNLKAHEKLGRLFDVGFLNKEADKFSELNGLDNKLESLIKHVSLKANDIKGEIHVSFALGVGDKKTTNFTINGFKKVDEDILKEIFEPTLYVAEGFETKKGEKLLYEKERINNAFIEALGTDYPREKFDIRFHGKLLKDICDTKQNNVTFKGLSPETIHLKVRQSNSNERDKLVVKLASSSSIGVDDTKELEIDIDRKNIKEIRP